MDSPIKNLGTIAVVVPVYKVEPYIRQCLDSLIAQTYPYWVAYVVDDGSPDNCGRIIDEYAAKDSRFKVFHRSNDGLGSARNLALEKIASEPQDFFAVTFLDSDDWLASDAYSDLVHKMLSEDADILFFGFKWAFPDRLTEREFNDIQGRIDRLAFIEAIYSYGDWKRKNGSWGTVWNKFFRTEVISCLRFIEDRSVIEDELFCLQAALRSRSFYFVKQSYYFYRRREDSQVNAIDIDSKRERGRLLALSELEASVIEDKPVLEERVKLAMLQDFVEARRKGFCQFIKDGNVFAKVAEVVLPFAGEWHQKGNISDTDYRLISVMASIYRSGCQLAGADADTDFMARFSPAGQLCVQFMSEEIDALMLEGQGYAKYRTLRVDIRNNGAEGSTVIEKAVTPAPSRLLKPAHIPNGMVIESVAGRMKVVVSVVGDGELDVRLIGRNERNAEGKRYPIWIDISYFAVNGEVVFDEVKTVCFDRRYQYTRPVKDGETVTLEFAWRECQSSTVLDELRTLQSDLKETRQRLKKAVQANSRLIRERSL